MHKSRTLILIAIIAAIVVAFSITLSPRSGEDDADGRLLFPGFSEEINQVREITVRDAEGSVTISRFADEWVVREKSDYPASERKVREVVLNLAQARILERKTSNPELYSELGVTDVDAADSKAVELVLEGVSNARLAALLVGDESRDEERFVRVPGESQSVLAAPVPEISADPSSWLQSEIVRVDLPDIARIDIEPADGQAVALAIDESGEAALQNIPAGKKVRYQFALNDYASTLSRLDLVDVRRAEGLEFDDAPAGRFMTRGGLEVAFESAADAGTTWLRFSAAPLEGADEESASAVDVLNARWKGWAYRVSESAMSRLSKPMSELVEDAETGPETDEAANPDPGDTN